MGRAGAGGDEGVLDDPVGASLRGQHAHLARRYGRAVSYVPEVATFSAVSGADEDPGAWADLARLLGGRGAFADMFSCPVMPPGDWEPVFTLEGRQLVWPGGSSPDDEPGGDGVVELGPADVPEMLALISRTEPGPFQPRTHELGTYLGIRDASGALVAMAGERLRPPGWTELSAVCTAPEARGQGHAARLIAALTTRILARAERPFLHAAETNTPALALYERLGFKTRRPVTFRGFSTP
ncbi:GNAT family N-acetyltransferase [Streptomyces boninensis]|uniref:GNAT family N-acetyltransferase n=1 Tax=Streptomyces boninensis TaxID=2039455 RepID=UPI003B20FBCE